MHSISRSQKAGGETCWVSQPHQLSKSKDDFRLAEWRLYGHMSEIVCSKTFETCGLDLLLATKITRLAPDPTQTAKDFPGKLRHNGNDPSHSHTVIHLAFKTTPGWTRPSRWLKKIRPLEESFPAVLWFYVWLACGQTPSHVGLDT